jgi:hypothetical protein
MHAILIAIVLFASVAFADEEWETRIQKNGLRTARSIALATTPDGNFGATLSIECQPGLNGTISMIYTVDQADRIKRFPFDEFEGPDAPLATKKLGQIEVRSKTGRVTLQKELAGYFASSRAFAFSFSVPAGQKNEVTQMLDKIIQGAGTVSFCVLTETPAKICSDFILRKSEEKIAETVKPCF